MACNGSDHHGHGLQRHFIEMSAPLTDVPNSLLMGQFINGLKEEIKAEVRVLNPLTLEKTMDVAVRVEERNRVHKILKKGVWRYRVKGDPDPFPCLDAGRQQIGYMGVDPWVKGVIGLKQWARPNLHTKSTHKSKPRGSNIKCGFP